MVLHIDLKEYCVIITTMAYDYDDKDVGILRLLMRNTKRSHREIAKELRIHPNTVMERIRRLEAAGVITGYSATIDYKKLGYGVSAVIQIDIEGRTEVAMKKIARLPFVHHAYRTTGEYDGIAIVVCRDIEELGKLVNEINSTEGVQRVNTKIVLAAFPGAPDFV